MCSRGMTRPQCKELNTFIHAEKQEVADVCSQNPLVINLHKSNHKFNVTVCKLKPTHRPCQYVVHNNFSTIIIGCSGGQPVHFEKSE
ncbi:ANG3 protein, partial [Amia calva]|nr:ANG3 protein [Amia calva]